MTRKVLLVGGPEQLADALRVHQVTQLLDKVKVAYGSGYEHFSDSGEVSQVDGEVLAVFRWCGRTMIAE